MLMSIDAQKTLQEIEVMTRIECPPNHLKADTFLGMTKNIKRENFRTIACSS